MRSGRRRNNGTGSGSFEMSMMLVSMEYFYFIFIYSTYLFIYNIYFKSEHIANGLKLFEVVNELYLLYQKNL